MASSASQNVGRAEDGICRYFMRGYCRDGDSCPYSHDRSKLPLCRYFMEGYCFYGEDCWFRHGENDQRTAKMEDHFDGSKSCFNILLAAAIASSSYEDSEDESEELTNKAAVKLTEVLGMWDEITRKHDEDHESNESGEESSDSDESRDGDLLLENLRDFCISLSTKKLVFKDWSVDDMYTLLLSVGGEIFHNAEYDEYDMIPPMVLGLMRFWPTNSVDFVELLLKISGDEEGVIKLKDLILMFCSCSEKIPHRDKHLGYLLHHAYHTNPSKYNHDTVAKILKEIEDYDMDSTVDFIKVFCSMGEQLQDAAELGKFVRYYLLTTGECDEDDCRCKTPECLCPLEIECGIAVILLTEIQQKMKFEGEDKRKFFNVVCDELFSKENLLGVASNIGIRNPLTSECRARPSAYDRRQIQRRKLEATKKVKCLGQKCSNQSKVDCPNQMCGRCCGKTGTHCDVHDNTANVLVNVRGVRSSKIMVDDKERITLKTRPEFLAFIEDDEATAKGIVFGPEFPVQDSDITRVIDKCKELHILELGDSDTGKGSSLSNKAVSYIADHCPQLRKLRLESVTRVSDESVYDVMKKCNCLEELTINGNDKIKGNMGEKSLKLLFDRTALPKLSYLNITDQYKIKRDVVQRLRRCRPQLQVVAGETDSDSMAWSMVLGMMKMNYGSMLF